MGYVGRMRRTGADGDCALPLEGRSLCHGDSRPRVWVIGFRLGTASPQSQSILGFLLRAIYNHIIVIIQLLLWVGSTQRLG